MRTARLDEIVRQKNPELKSAVELFARGQSAAALDLLHQHGHVQVVPDREERIRMIAKLFAESPGNTLIVSPDNASRRDLNDAVRQDLKSTGMIASEDRSIPILFQRQEMTGADRAWANHYEIGDVVRYARGSKLAGIEAGTYATVVAVNPSSNLLSVEKQSGEFATYDPRRLAGVSVYRETARDFSAGDHIQFTAPDKALGVSNRDLGVIDSISQENRVTVRLGDSRRIEFDANEHRHFDHTSYSAQGLTAERVLIHANTSVHPDLVSSRFGYVAVSRGSREAMVFTDDLNKLARNLGAETTKTSALELGNALPNP
jgi:hypothetical protein